MPAICPELDLTGDEHDLLEVNDEEVDRWLRAAKAGKEEQQQQLLCWAYVTARNHYCWVLLKGKERLLSPDDIEDLAGDFLLEFDHAIPSMRHATRFTRSVLKRTLSRYLRKKRRRVGHETPRDLRDLPLGTVAGGGEHELEDWDDETFSKYQTVLRVLKESDEKTRRIIASRFGDPPLNASEIAEEMDITPAAIRMRLARFYANVRDRYSERG